MAPVIRLRRLGLMERWHCVRHRLELDSCVVASAQYTSDDGHPLTKEILFPALRTLVEEHASLGIRLEGNETTAKVYFVRLPRVDLSSVVECSGHSNVQEAYENHLSRGFETQTDVPLWRVEVLADNVVLFAIHHAVGDGMSVLAFHLNLLRALQNGRGYDGSPVVETPQSNRLLPPIEHSTPVWPSFSLAGSMLYDLLAPASWSKMRNAWTGPRSPLTSDITTLVRIFTFPPNDVAAFITATRAHNATLTSTTYVLAVCALSQLLADDPRKYKRIGGTVALSLRGVAGVPDDVLCDYPSTFHELSRVTPAFSWNEAKRMAVTLNEQKRKGREMVGMLRFLELPGVYLSYLKGQLGGKREAGVRLSNLGRVQLPGIGGKWTMSRTMFAQCDVVTGDALNINMTGDPTGALNVTLSWGKATGLDTAFVEAFMASFQERFKNVVAQN
ncbi:alcohol acetyltransferase [Mycena sanguinolenta]|nr:alcohol acetyltransferase [Mycena sanguinolenta]